MTEPAAAQQPTTYDAASTATNSRFVWHDLMTTDPAAVHAPSPTFTGAMNIVSTPPRTALPIVVRCFERPS